MKDLEKRLAEIYDEACVQWRRQDDTGKWNVLLTAIERGWPEIVARLRAVGP